ncbi:MAG: S24 family peptidase [Cytophagia bacterium]|nr:S24 family peptidase [Cytophagia bacterium]
MRIATLFDLSLDVLVQDDLSKPTQKKKQATKREVLAITVDKNDRENIELIPQKAAAGYLSGYQDPEYMSELPKISLPVLPRNRTHRAFEIQGESMLPIQPGSIVFGEYVESLEDLKNGKPYILVTKQDGIVFKRVFQFKEHKDTLLLVSDNRAYEPYTIKTAEVMELWLVHSFYTKSLPDSIQSTSPLADQLALQLVALHKKK